MLKAVYGFKWILLINVLLNDCAKGI